MHVPDEVGWFLKVVKLRWPVHAKATAREIVQC